MVNAYYEAIENAVPVGRFINRQVVASTIGFCDEDDARARRKGAEVAAWYLEQSRQRFTLEWAGVDADAVPEEYQFYVQGGATRGGSPSQDPQQQKPHTPEDLLAGGGYCVGDPDACIRVIEEFEAMGVDEIMPIFQAGHATNDEVMNSIRLFGEHVIPHFQAKETQR